MMICMTQLFDTTSYDAADLDDEATPTTRHLRSVPFDADTELAERRNDWRLDETTIEIGRRGIALAREALRESAKSRSTARRAA